MSDVWRTLKIFLIWKILAVTAFLTLFRILPRNYSFDKSIDLAFINKIGWAAVKYFMTTYFLYEGIPRLGAPFSTWDGVHYIFLSENFYTEYGPSTAFYPLLPALMSLTNQLGLSSVASGILWSFVFSFGTLFYFVKITDLILSPRDSQRALLFFLFFPTALHLTAINTEALFLALAFSLTYYLLFKKSYWAVLPAVLLPLSRGPGLLMGAVAFVYLIWVYLLPRILKKQPIKENLQLTVTVTLSLLMGQLIYFLFMFLRIGDPFAGFKAQQFYPMQFSIMNLLKPWRLIDILFFTYWHWFGFLHSGLDKIFLLAVFLLAVPVFKSRNAFMIIAYLILTAVTTFMGELSAFSRMALCIFPIFLYAPQMLKRLGTKGFAALISVFAGGQLYFIARYVNYY